MSDTYPYDIPWKSLENITRLAGGTVNFSPLRSGPVIQIGKKRNPSKTEEPTLNWEDCATWSSTMNQRQLLK